METLPSSATRSRWSGSTRPTSTSRRPPCPSRGRARSRPGSGTRPGWSARSGLAPNKLMAKIASDLDKPDGLFVLTEENWLEAVGERPASLLPGVGPQDLRAPARASGIETVADLAGADAAALERRLRPAPRPGPARARQRHRRHRADHRARAQVREPRDDLPLRRQRPRTRWRETRRRAWPTSVCGSLAEHGCRGRTVTLKIRPSPWKTHTRSRTLPSPTRRPRDGGRRGAASCSRGSTRRTRCACSGSASPGWSADEAERPRNEQRPGAGRRAA